MGIWAAWWAGVFCWAMTAAGAGLVFFFRRPGARITAGMVGFSAGVMLAAAFWSLLAPARAQAEALGQPAWAVMAAGFLAGGLGLWLLQRQEPEGAQGRALRTLGAMTVHNIPEGLAVGVAFGAAAAAPEAGPWLLAIGIGLQDLPEGAASALPLLRAGCSRKRAFFLGQLSGFAEPAACLLGAALAQNVRPALPFLLSLAAGTMVAVTAGELLGDPDGHQPTRTLWLLIGFAVMMVLDVALG